MSSVGRALVSCPLLLLAFTASCQAPEPDFRDQNKEAVRSFYEALDAQDFERLRAAVAPDLVVKVIGTDDTYPWAAVEDMIHMYYGAFEGYDHVLDHLIAEDDWVVARITYRGTHTGDFDGTPASGNPIRYGGTHILRIVDGVIGEFWYLEDDLRLMQQIGLGLVPVEAGS